jgi:asparagine synthase (glutamine-hydrolysing)
MVADVPIGAFLSGGIDSSIVVAMMTRFTDKPIQAFTVSLGRPGERFLDERVYARQLAARYRLDHVEIDVQPEASAVLPEIVDAFDEPFADDSVIPSYYVARATAGTVKVAMSGLGGDELFGGYKRHLAVNLSRYFNAIPAPVRTGILGALASRLPEIERLGDSIDHLKRFVGAGAAGGAAQYRSYLETRSWAERSRIFVSDARKRMDTSLTAAIVSDLYDSYGDIPPLDRALRTDMDMYLPDDILTLTDRLSMWHSLEIRVPFLHHPLVELAAGLPAPMKISGFTQKHILRAVASRWIPRSIIEHRKQGFEAPMGAWLRGPLLPLLDELIEAAERRGPGIFDYQEIRRLRDEHVRGARKNSKLLFAVLVFLLWAHKNRAIFA